MAGRRLFAFGNVCPAVEFVMEIDAFIIPTAAVALAEIGDKTQLLTLVLAARFNAARSIILGILIATLVNHGLSVLLGQWLVDFIPEGWITWIVAGSFLAVGLWLLIPDKDDEESSRFYAYGPFLATLVLFFLAEIGDKTQVATVILAGQYESALLVTLGTTAGMMLANVPVIYLGRKAMDFVPLAYVRYAACALFLLMAIATAFL